MTSRADGKTATMTDELAATTCTACDVRIRGGVISFDDAIAMALPVVLEHVVVVQVIQGHDDLYCVPRADPCGDASP
jgi:hypothetical protein